MKIVRENYMTEIKNIVSSKAKYQKVMLIFDDEVSSVETSKIYEEICTGKPQDWCVKIKTKKERRDLYVFIKTRW